MSNYFTRNTFIIIDMIIVIITIIITNRGKGGCVSLNYKKRVNFLAKIIQFYLFLTQIFFMKPTRQIITTNKCSKGHCSETTINVFIYLEKLWPNWPKWYHILANQLSSNIASFTLFLPLDSNEFD